MPQNENGIVTCINHPENEMLAPTFVTFPTWIFMNTTLTKAKEDLPGKVFRCEKCGYLEFYTIRPEIDLPNHTHPVIETIDT